ncbi:MCM-domain-containing protein [Atractiella rhizophila]|nr:MCM-domain-containing protein [Atractiella rhizophila]
MNAFDAGRVYAVPVVPPSSTTGTTQPSQLINRLHSFIQSFRHDTVFFYRDTLRSNILKKEYFLEVEVEDLLGYDEELGSRIMTAPGEVVPLFEQALRMSARQVVLPYTDLASMSQDERTAREKLIPPIQLILRSKSRLIRFRELQASQLGLLVRLPGIVTSASVMSSRATRLFITCRNCRHNQTIDVPGGFAGFTLPRQCPSVAGGGQSKDCPLDPFIILHEKSTFVDQQVLKIQENPDLVPVGELPRTIGGVVDRYLCGKVVPGNRIIATAVYSTYSSAKSSKSQGAAALRTPYLRILGLQIDSTGSSGKNIHFSAEEEEEFTKFSKTPNFLDRFCESVAPSVYGSTDIKKAIACLLFGGSKKILPDGMRLRGDINVLLMGDPGTAKSQMLKFVEKVAPIAVYTSGKGSSAAGLTASVQRDANTREFYLEGGAMVLSDGGVVCIDEFDKMRDEDRVAIHEAMEQQTISIAKAGITTVLNSRTSVLAAANPVFGRYDETKSPGENIDFQTTILSRFDMIFIVKDEHDEARDRTIARHVMGLHVAGNVQSEAVGEIDIDKMKRYISFCKSRCAPRLSPAAAEQLSSHFVSLRRQVQQVERDANERSSIPITIRQLEAIIRISESLAKMTLSPTVELTHVDEAMRLFKFSTMNAVQFGGNMEGISRTELIEEMNKIEAEVKRRMPISYSVPYSKLVKEFVVEKGYTQHALEKTLWVLEKREVIRFSGGKRLVHRIGV